MTPYFEIVSPESLAADTLDQLLALGWYRAQQSIFTCSHLDQEAQHRVHWMRFVIGNIKDTARHKRIRNTNKTFRYTIEDVVAITPKHRELHKRYRASINFDGALSIEECLYGEAPQDKSIFNTKCISVFDDNKLIASGYFDVGNTAIASILHFFDPFYARYSLGKYLILLTIDYGAKQGFTFYYPGYVVESLPKMDYKLFLGKDLAQYFDPETLTWKIFNENILGTRTNTSHT